MDTLAVWHSTPFEPFGDDGVATTFVFHSFPSSNIFL